MQKLVDWWKWVNDYLNKREVLMVLLLVVVVVRLPSLFEPFWYGDENIYLAIGQGMRQGLTLYHDITDYPNKPPMIYVLAALAKNVFNFRLILLFWSLVTVGVVYRLLGKLAKSEIRRVGLTVLFIWLTCTPMFEGLVANAEIFFILPTSVAAVLLVDRLSGKEVPDWAHFGAGLFLGLAFLFKIHVAGDILALGYVFYVLTRMKKLGVKDWVRVVVNKQMWWWVGGILVPIVVVVSLWLLQGVSPMQLFLNAAGSGGYVAVTNPKDWLMATVGMGTLKARLVALAIITWGLLMVRKKVEAKTLLAVTWLVFALFAALLSGRNYPHYLIQVSVPLILVIERLIDQVSMLVTKKRRRRLRVAQARLTVILIASALLMLGGAYWRFGFFRYPTWSYYRNFGEYVSGKIDREEYYARLDWRMPRNYALAEYIRQVSMPDDQIYIWGTESEVYVLANRLPVEKLVVSFHVEDLDYYDETLEALIKERPEIIVVMESEWREFAGLDSLLAARYALIKMVGDPRRQVSEGEGSRALVYKLI